MMSDGKLLHHILQTTIISSTRPNHTKWILPANDSFVNHLHGLYIQEGSVGVAEDHQGTVS